MYEIGPFRLDPSGEVLTCGGQPVALGSRAIAVLTMLVENRNEHVSKNRIMDAAWPGVVVEESNLAVQISAIRRALAQAPGGERWVETLARRGYRFVGPVQKVDAARAPTPRAARSNLSEPLTSFIGREPEVARVKRMLPNVRLLTLVGTGGIGKTRLAQKVAAECAGRYGDGAWFVDLAPIADARHVASAVAQVLKVRDASRGSVEEALCADLKGMQVLLVLDNCEHVVDACARLVEKLLRSVGEVTVLATSREPLGIPGEQVLPLPPLRLPDPDASASVIAETDAVRLFLDRARRQLPDFELTEARARILAALCMRLDGIPLALELAAARVRTLSVEQIHARLDDRFRLLTSGARTALPRHRTLRAALDWSYDLLSEKERCVLRRIAIFAGGFTLEAAAEIASSAQLDDFAVTDLLQQLVSRSLVVGEAGGAGVRYRMLETTRAYAREQLEECGEVAGLQERHARFYRAFVDRAAEDWLRMPDADWCAAYEPERDNVRAALDWAISNAGDPTLVVGLAGASGPLWSMLGLTREGIGYLETAAAGPAIAEDDKACARVFMWLGMLLDGAPARAVAAYRRALEAFSRTDEALWRAHTQMRSARVLAEVGEIAAARAALDEARPTLEASRVPKALGLHADYMGFLRLMEGDPAGAREWKERALRHYLPAGAQALALDTLGNLADVIWALGDLEAAIRAFREAIAMLRGSPVARKRSLGFTLSNFAGILIEHGERSEALAAAREGLAYLRDGGYAWIFMDHLAVCAALGGDPERAARLAGYADASYARNGAQRQPNEARAHARCESLLATTLADERRAALRSEGAALDPEAAFALALEG